MNEFSWAERASPVDVADHIVAVVANGARKIAVPGGATPIPIFAELAARSLRWTGVEITLTDERIVPEHHPASNFAQVRRSLRATGATITKLRPGPMRPLDLAWLGMGSDGHIASIFPNELEEHSLDSAVRHARPDPLPDEAPFERLTLTLPALAGSLELILVASGLQKRRLLVSALAGERDLPITRLLHMPRGPLRIFWREA